MRKSILVVLVCMLAMPAYADDAGIPPPPAEPALVDAGAGSSSAPEAKPADKLHDPIGQPMAAFDDLKAAKKQGWAAAILCALVMLTTAFARASQTWPDSKLLSWFAKRKTAILVITGLGTVSAAAFNVLALGGQWTAVMWAAAGAALTMIAPKHEPKS